MPMQTTLGPPVQKVTLRMLLPKTTRPHGASFSILSAQPLFDRAPTAGKRHLNYSKAGKHAHITTLSWLRGHLLVIIEDFFNAIKLL